MNLLGSEGFSKADELENNALEVRVESLVTKLFFVIFGFIS